jgi:hypothetical protein
MHRTLLLACGAVGIVLIFFFGTLVALNRFAPLCPRGKMTMLSTPFTKFASGVAYSAPAPALEGSADTPAAPQRSNFLVCENSFALGPAHTVHAEIDNQGKGRFSHWTGIGFVFSSSDNSDPNANGRSYVAVMR